MEMKQCNKCGEEKELSQFYIDKRNNKAVSRCKKCAVKKIHNKIVDNKKVCRKCCENRSLEEFNKQKNSPDGLKSLCKYCMKTFSISFETKEEIKNLYLNSKLSCKSIAKKYNVSSATIERILKNNKIKAEKDRKVNIVNSNLVEDYFEIIDTEEKAYFLGFIYSDGNINFIKNSARLSIEISEKDGYILEKFKINCKINHNPINKSNYMCIFSKKICKDLIDKGVIPNKSLILKFPEENIIPQELIRHFIRGYFDGDGGFHISENKNSLSIVSYIVGTKEFLEKINSYLPFNTHMRQVTEKNTYEIRFTRKQDVLTFGEFIYKDTELYLTRKKELWEKFISQYNINYKHLTLKVNKFIRKSNLVRPDSEELLIIVKSKLETETRLDVIKWLCDKELYNYSYDYAWYLLNKIKKEAN